MVIIWVLLGVLGAVSSRSRVTGRKREREKRIERRAEEKTEKSLFSYSSSLASSQIALVIVISVCGYYCCRSWVYEMLGKEEEDYGVDL